MSQIETFLRELYEEEHWQHSLNVPANLSRLLALWAARSTIGPDATSDMVEVVDGSEDRGIDAIGVNNTTKQVVFVQSKWRQDGSGSMALGDVLKFLDGARALLDMGSGHQLVHASPEMRHRVQQMLRTPGASIVLVTATTAAEALSANVVQPIQDLLAQLNDLPDTEPMASHRHLGQAELFRSISDVSRPTVDIEMPLLDWGKTGEPHRMYYGRVSAVTIARWFEEHGADLFAENIRVMIPRSEINDGILQTVRNEPENFAFYNNGITVLARRIETSVSGAVTRDVGFLRLSGASVVNGAQTVSTLARALDTDIEPNLERAYVIVRCVEVPDGEESLGQSITRFANTQNEVSSQDFAFLDPEQHRLARELQVLGFEYLVRSAEQPRSEDRSKVIEIRDAAVALACAHPRLSHAITAKREVSRLFTDRSAYGSLFNASTDPLVLHRAVQIVAEVDARLDDIQSETDGIEAGVAVHGRRVIAHLILQDIGARRLADPDLDVEAVIAGIADAAGNYLDAIVQVFPENAYPGNVFKNHSRVQGLLEAMRAQGSDDE